MTLSDKVAYRQVIGSLMLNPLLFLEYADISPTDFDITVARICFVIIKKLYEQGLQTLTPIEVDQEVDKHENSAIEYRKNGGLDFLKKAYEFAVLENFGMYYARLKKYSLLRRLKREGYDISEYYIEDKDVEDPLMETKIKNKFEDATIEEILNSIEGKYNIIRNEYLNGGKK